MTQQSSIDGPGRRQLEEWVTIAEEQARRKAANKILAYYPDEGPLRRELYPKHLSFFAAGKEHRERLFLGANRSGKTTVGGYEVAVHLSGLYPDWWPGYMFKHPISAWFAGDTRASTRDIQQQCLLGPPGSIGTGMIRGDLIKNLRPAPGVSNAYEQVMVQHKSGGTSIIQARSYDQGRELFQGTEKDVIWLDEECPMDVYTECLTRTMAIEGSREGGLIYLTFTPLKGMTELVLMFLGNQVGKQQLH